MSDIASFLSQCEVQFFATIGLDGKPKVRPFQFMFEEDSKLFFCTANTKEVYKEILKQPYIELSASGPNYSWIRIEGKVVFSDSLEAKAKVFELSPIVKSIYKTPDHPAFEVFYLEDVSAIISDLSGNPPRKITL